MPASLLDPDYQFGASPLPGASGPPTDLLGLGQLQVTPPPPGQPDLGDALGQTYQMITDAMAKARDQWPSVEEQRGLLAPLPGWQGTAVDAAKQWAEGVMMGTTAPGEVPNLSPAERFQDAFDAAHAKSGLADVSNVHFFEHGPNEVEISHIQVDPDKRGQGIGNTLMGTATDLADQHGVTLHASPASDADASAGLDYEGLRDWYQRWGFDEPGGGDRLTRRPSADAGQEPPGDAPPPGIVAYHGSPHSFDQFDSSKIGTGEGAQAYGHGLYFAEKEGTAQSYRDTLATDPRDTLNNYLRGIMNFHAPDDPAITADAIKNGLSNHDDLAMRQLGGNDAAIKDITTILRGYDPNSGSHSQAAMDAYGRLDKVMPQGSPGSMYQVNIGADPEHMLQWDQTVGQHPPALRDKLLDMGYGDTDSGADVYSHLARGPNGDVGASQRLQDAGIPGISYLDAGSRGVGTGMKNHVVFDANTIDILRKYGIAGLIAGGGAAATQRQSNAQ